MNSSKVGAPNKIAVLIPCYNEATTIAQVVGDFRKTLPDAEVYVYDNNSSDGTIETAQKAGAIVKLEERQGKGAVVRRMFADTEADIYVMVDGDDTYDAASASKLIALLLSGPYDVVNGARETEIPEAYRMGHRLGNRILTGIVRHVFGARTKDMLSGYKVFSRRFVKSFPAMSSGFEIETELVIHALELQLAMAEMGTPYRDRPAGSTSKLRTFRDGFRILRLIGKLIKEERPLAFFAVIGACALLVSIIFGLSVVIEFYETGLVPRLPTAVFAVGAMLAALLSIFTGLMLDTVTRGRREFKRLIYMMQPSPDSITAQPPNSARP